MRLKESERTFTKNKDKVVVDTSVLISCFAFGGIPKLAMEKVFKQAEIFISRDLLEEYRKTPLELHLTGKINREQLDILISGIAIFVMGAKLVVPTTNLKICRDPEDNMLLECCLASKANILITWDKDLLTLKNLPFPLDIITPRKYLEINK